VRGLVKEAIQMEEDIALAAFASKREKTFTKGISLKHAEIWS